jgi:hypothetical protein
MKKVVYILVMIGLIFGAYKLGRELGVRDKVRDIKLVTEKCASMGLFMLIEPGHLNEPNLYGNCGTFKVRIIQKPELKDLPTKLNDL